MDRLNCGQGIVSEWKCHRDWLVRHITKNGDVVSLLTFFWPQQPLSLATAINSEYSCALGVTRFRESGGWVVTCQHWNNVSGSQILRLNGKKAELFINSAYSWWHTPLRGFLASVFSNPYAHQHRKRQPPSTNQNTTRKSIIDYSPCMLNLRVYGERIACLCL